MKKKLIVLIVALVSALFCACGLIACGGGDDGGGGGKHVIGLAVVDGEGNTHSEYDMGSFAYRSSPGKEYSLYAEYSDGTKRKLTQEDGFVDKYTYNNQELASAPTSYKVGRYYVRYEYEHCYAAVTFDVVTTATSTPYTMSLDRWDWKYGEQPTFTVFDEDDNELDATDFSVCYISKEKYDEIKNAEDFTFELSQKASNAYDSDGEYYWRVKPGKYYYFAYFEGMVRANSTLVEATIHQAPLKPVYADGFNFFNLANNWWPKGEIGTIPLSQIVVSVDRNKLSWETESGEPYEGMYDVDWKNPDEEIDSTIDGKKREIKCSFSDEGYADYLFPEKVTILFQKSSLSVPTVGDREDRFNHVFTYDGQDHDIVLNFDGNTLSGDYIEMYNKLLTIKDGDGKTVTIGEGGVLKTVSEEATYTFTIELKDKVNYQWYWTDYEADDYPTRYDTDNKVCQFFISPLSSWVGLGNTGYYLSIDDNRQVKYKLDPGEDTQANNMSPYKKDTLSVRILESYYHELGDYTLTTEIDAAVEVVEEADGYDYIVITVNDFKNIREFSGGRVILEVTAKGDNHYDDIYQVFDDIQIERYDYQFITCPVKFDDDALEMPAGTTVAELYRTYPALITPLGKWVLEYEYDNSGSWVKLGDEASLPQMTLSCRLVFESDFVKNVGEIVPYRFTLTGTPNN